MTTPPLFTIFFGPTASGKTDLAYRLASQEANILSFDSRHVYQEMNIVTGKDLSSDAYPVTAIFPNDTEHTVYAHQHVTDTERFPSPFPLTHLTDHEKAIHWMSTPLLFGLDIVRPDQKFSIRHYYEYAKSIIQAHREQRKPLILVGGSWQYASVLLDPPASLFAERDEGQRKKLEALSVEELQQRVQQQNPERWNGMNASDQANPRRLIRALEFTEATAPVASALIQPDEYTLRILNPDLEVLEQRIRARIEKRLAEGALEETKHLIQKYRDWSLPAFSSTGYGILRQHLEEGITLEEAKELWFLQERQYVKRQKTWIKKIATEQ